MIGSVDEESAYGPGRGNHREYRKALVFIILITYHDRYTPRLMISLYVHMPFKLCTQVRLLQPHMYNSHQYLMICGLLLAFS